MEEELSRMAEQAQNSYYGKYRGIVADNCDPEKLGRLKLLVPSLLGETVTGWALPCLPFGGLADQGAFSVPEPDSSVWVEFEAGDLNFPIWTGVFWRPGDIPSEAALDEPTTRIFKTPSGHRLQFDDAEGEEKIILFHKSEAKMEMDENGAVSLVDSEGNAINLDASGGEIKIEDGSGNKITIDGSGMVLEDTGGNKVTMGAGSLSLEGQTIELKGSQILLGGPGGEPVIKGQTFLTLFATHMHTSTAPGTPTSPPIPQGEMMSLSQKVMTS